MKKRKIKEHYETEPVLAEKVFSHKVNNDKDCNALDDLTISLVKKGIVEINKPRELWISCVALNKKSAKALKLSLELANKFNAKHYKTDGLWFVDGMKMILYDQLKSELNLLRATVKLHSCELSDWHVEVDKSDC